MIIFMDDIPLNGVLRLDKWLWYARFMKSRSKATKFCQSNSLCVNGSIGVKAHFLVKKNDIITFSIGNDIKIIRVLDLGIRRGPAPEAQALYEDLSPPIPLNREDHKFQMAIGKREVGSGRPTKGQRRATDKLIAKDEQWQ
jgi:ribosome-associated heat shock protein Hsp15